MLGKKLAFPRHFTIARIAPKNLTQTQDVTFDLGISQLAEIRNTIAKSKLSQNISEVLIYTPVNYSKWLVVSFLWLAGLLLQDVTK